MLVLAVSFRRRSFTRTRNVTFFHNGSNVVASLSLAVSTNSARYLARSPLRPLNTESHAEPAAGFAVIAHPVFVLAIEATPFDGILIAIVRFVRTFKILVHVAVESNRAWNVF
jgi:hypothetical protein